MALTKITANVIEAGAISTASLADTSITADKLHTTLDLTGKTITVATASAGDNDTTVASTAFVTTAIANLTDSAPAALDTLNELAAALNDDANFSTTVTNSIATKMPLAGGSFTGDVTFGTGADFGSGAASSTTDLSRHLALWGTNYGFNVTSNTINLVSAGTNTLSSTSSTLTSKVNHDFSAGIDVTGNITVTGTVDGRDIASDGSKLDGIESGATADQTASEILTAIKTVDGAGSGLDADLLDGQQGSYYLAYGNLTGTPTIPSLSGYATETYVGTQISNLVDSSPAALNTLNELAAALGDDANFSTTVTNSIATKLPLAGGTMTGALNVTNSSSITIGTLSTTDTGSLVLTGSTANKQSVLKCTNGNLHIDTASGNTMYLNFYSGTGVAFGNGAAGAVAWMGSDGDLWKGGSDNAGSKYWNAGDFANNSGNWNTAYTVANAALPKTGGAMTGAITTNSTFDGRDVATDGAKLDGIAAGANNYTIPSTVAYNTANFDNTQRIRFSANATNNWDTIATAASSQGSLEVYNTGAGNDAFMSFHAGSDYAGYFGLDADTNDLAWGGWSVGAVKYRMFHAGNSTQFTSTLNTKLAGIETGATADQTAAEILTAIKTVDGAGSGLDADLLDGHQLTTASTASTVVERDSSGDINCRLLRSEYDTTNSSIGYIMTQVDTATNNYVRPSTPAQLRSTLNVENGATADQTAAEILTAIKTVDGAGSGLDADLLDGISSASFLRSDATDTFTTLTGTTLTTSGNVGVGATPTTKLYVSDSSASAYKALTVKSSNANSDVGISLIGGGGSDFRLQQPYNSAGLFFYDVTNSAERLRIYGNGEVGINTTNGGGKLNIAFTGSDTSNWGTRYYPSGTDSTLYIVDFIDYQGQRMGYITGNAVGNTLAYQTSSDYRLKENVDYTWNATTRLKQLKPARFNWIRDESNTLVDGFLAHEVEGIVPEAVSGEKDATETKTNAVVNSYGNYIADNVTEEEWLAGKEAGTYDADTTWVASHTQDFYQGIDQSKLVPLLTKALQEQQTIIESLEARITALES